MATQPENQDAVPRGSGDNPWVTSVQKNEDGNLLVKFKNAQGRPREAMFADKSDVHDVLARWRSDGRLVRADRLILADNAISGFAGPPPEKRIAAAEPDIKPLKKGKKKKAAQLTPEMVAERSAKFGKQARLAYDAKQLAEYRDDRLVYVGLIAVTTIATLIFISA